MSSAEGTRQPVGPSAEAQQAEAQQAEALQAEAQQTEAQHAGTQPAEGAPASRRARRARTRPGAGLAAAAAQDFSLATAVGGPRGAVEAVAPGLVFVTWFGITRDLRTSLVAAIGVAVLAVLARVVTRSAPTQALSGLVGVAICAFVAARTGEARDFYLPGLLINVAYGSVLALSTVRTPAFRVGGTHVPAGPFPALGLLIGPMVGEGMAWRRDPRRLSAYRKATLLLAGLYPQRLAVQLPLFIADAVELLGIARIVLGVPAFALTLWLVWRLLRAVPKAVPEAATEH